VRDAIAGGVRAWLGELERQARLAGLSRPAEVAFEVYSLGLGANACTRLLREEGAFARTRAAVERLLATGDLRTPDC
jgi:hypothetical protein